MSARFDGDGALELQYSYITESTWLSKFESASTLPKHTQNNNNTVIAFALNGTSDSFFNSIIFIEGGEGVIS